jgi:hypothetical protein
MRLKQVASVTAAAVIAGLLQIEGCSAPTDHDIHIPGGVPLAVGIPFDDGGARVFGPLGPALSLSEIRIQTWDQRGSRSGEPRPSDARLSQLYWPKLLQSPNTLYVGLPGTCAKYAYVYGFNVEFLHPSRTLIVHCHVALPWIQVDFSGAHGGSRGLAPSTVLVTVSTGPIPSGQLRVVREDRIEHFVGDQVTPTQLGTVNIS